MAIEPLTIITGASSNHFKSLKQLLESADLHEPKTPIIVYDLGLTAQESKQLQGPYRKVLKFSFQNYPSHVNIHKHAGQYAWKPIIIADTLNSVQGNIFWLDAGCKIEEPLTELRTYLIKHGLYTPRSGGTIQDWTDPATMRKLHVTQDVAKMSNRAGGVVAIKWECPVSRSLIQRWKLLALNKAIIAPKGSNRKNHRQDQSILSILVNQALQSQLFEHIPSHYLGISVHNDVD